MRDISELAQEILTRRGLSQDGLGTFLHDRLSARPKISILGFSLGGLVALQAFLAQPNTFNSCVLINSGASFQDMNASQVFRESWRDLQRGILESTRHLSRREMASNFERVFLGHEKVVLHDQLMQQKNKILVLLGGSDPIFNAGNIANILPQETGLAVFQIPSLTHFINIRSMGGDIWDEWSNFTAKMILSFDKFRPAET